MGDRKKFSSSGKVFCVGVALAGSLMLYGAPKAQADELDCQRRVVRIDHELHRAALKHGWDSPQAAEKRAKLKVAREWCWEHSHRWWDEDGRRWRTERDWDEHDHDRDRPH